jgi:hypothetical protein
MSTRYSHGPRRSRPYSNVGPVEALAGFTGSELSALEDCATDRPSDWVRVTCPVCGVVRVRADRVVLRNCTDDLSWSYRAQCSDCNSTFLGFTPESLALPAIAAGVQVETWTMPVPSARRGGSPLRAVDALELHLALLEPDWFDELERVEPQSDR